MLTEAALHMLFLLAYICIHASVAVDRVVH